MLDHVLSAIDAQRSQSLDGLCEFLRFPSVSAKPLHAPDLRQCASWLTDRLKDAGLQAQMHETPGHPIILAQNQQQPHRPTVLLYGHYDVQPPEPLDQWTTPPFTPTLRDGAVYARGAADDKGQFWTHIQALSAWHRAGGLPLNVKVLLEGEEEIGSEHLEQFIQSHRDQLRADIALISDTNQFARSLPAITCGLRGLVYMEVFLTGPDHDLHSGLYGGAVPNPANILCQLLASLHDSTHRVTIQGFYDDVLALSDDQRQQWRQLPFDESQLAHELGLPELSGEAGYSALERKWARPTCDINGLTSGYQGHGAKTIIPSTASAKVSMRLVPNQDPLKIQQAFENHLRQRCPKNVKIAFAHHGASPAILVPTDGQPVHLAAQAIEIGFGLKPVFMREGGSIPVVGSIKRNLGIDTLLVGFGLPDDRVHSPNEKFDLDALYCGTRTAAALYQKLSTLPPAATTASDSQS